MSELLIDIKKQIAPLIKNIELLLGIISLLIGLGSAFANLLGLKVVILFICVGIFFLIRKMCSMVIKATIERIEGFPTPKYLPSYRKAAKYLRLFSFALPLGGIFNFFLYATTSGCPSPSKSIGVIISKFSFDETFDGFSYKMTNLLRNELFEVDTITVVQEKNFLDISGAAYVDTANLLFEANCFTHGLLVFGCRNKELFDCSIYINNMPDIQTSEIRSTKKNSEILYIQNPSLINFSIDNQAQQIAEFIIALLEYNSHCYAQTSNRLNKIIQSNTSAGKFASYCYLFMGNSYALTSNHETAIQCYERGLAQDSTNSYLNYNAGVSKLSLGDTLGALTTFKIAAISNSNMKIPYCLENWENTHKHALNATTALVEPSESTPQNMKFNTTDDSLSFFEFLSPGKYPLWYPVIKRNSNKKYGVTNSSRPYDTIFEFQYDTIRFIQAGRRLYCLMKINNKYGIGAFYQNYYEVNQNYIEYWYGSTLIPVEQNSEFEALKKLYDYRRKENAPYVPKSKH
jgi:hypothetical protein